MLRTKPQSDESDEPLHPKAKRKRARKPQDPSEPKSKRPKLQKAIERYQTQVFTLSSRITPSFAVRFRKWIEDVAIKQTDLLTFSSRLLHWYLATKLASGESIKFPLNQDFFSRWYSAVGKLGKSPNDHVSQDLARFMSPNSPWIAQKPNVSGLSYNYAKIAQGNATIFANSIVFRFFRIQKKRLLEKLRMANLTRKITNNNKGPFTAKQINILAVKLQIILRDVSNFRRDAEYPLIEWLGSEFDQIFILNLIHQEFTQIPTLFFLENQMTFSRKNIARHAHLFLPYLYWRSQEIEANSMIKANWIINKAAPKVPLVTKGFSLCPIFSFRRKMVPLEIATFQRMMKGLYGKAYNNAENQWWPLRLGAETSKIQQITTDGVKLCVLLRKLKPSIEVSTETCLNNSVLPNEEQELEVSLKTDVSSLKKELQQISGQEIPSNLRVPRIPVNSLGKGLYSMAEVDFRAFSNPPRNFQDGVYSRPVVGIDPGRTNLITFWEQGLTKQHHLERHNQLRVNRPDSYFLQPFGLRATAAYHQKGTPAYLRKLRNLKRKHQYPQDLSGMTFVTCNPDLLTRSFECYLSNRSTLIRIFCDRRLAKERFCQYSRHQNYSTRLLDAVRLRFPDPKTIFVFGSAHINGCRFKGAPPTSAMLVKKVLAWNYTVLNCPEYFTSQKCIGCGNQLSKSKHRSKRTGKMEPNQGQLICRDHGVCSRDQNSAKNFLEIFRNSCKMGIYQRPKYLTTESSSNEDGFPRSTIR